MFHREQKRELKKIALTPAEVYAIFGVPPGTLANLRCCKRGPRYFIGKYSGLSRSEAGVPPLPGGMERPGK